MKLDKNTILGLLLIFGIVLTWTMFFGKKPPKKDPLKDKQQTQALVDTSTARDTAHAFIGAVDTTDSTFVQKSDSEKTALLLAVKTAEFGDFSAATQGTLDSVNVVTDYMKVTIPTKGAFVSSLVLMGKWKTADSLPLPIVERDTFNRFSVQMKHEKSQSGFVETSDLYFVSDAPKGNIVLKGGEKKSVSFKAKVDDKRYIEFLYTFTGNKYDYDFEIKMVGMNKVIDEGNYFIHWNGNIPKTEKTMSLMLDKTSLYYKNLDEVSSLNPKMSEKQELVLTGNTQWISFRSQFFMHTMIAEGNPLGWAKVTQETPHQALVGYGGVDPGKVVSNMTATLEIPYSRKEVDSRKLKFYAGPLEFSSLKQYAISLEDQVQLGWGPLRWINRGLVMPTFKFLQGTIGNYGVIIFILAILIKIIVFPMTHKTYVSTAKMRIINQQPEIKALEEKYKNEAVKLNQEKMAIYRQMGVNPMGGCLPALLQYPVLIAMFMFFPNAIDLRQEGFLWANDLSTYDSVWEFGFYVPMYGDHLSLFTLLMTISIYAFTLMQQKAQGSSMNANPTLKYLPYIMPLLFLGFLNNYSAGLSYYYFLSNLLSIAQTYITKRFVDDEKLLQQMKDMQKKKKESGKTGGGALANWAEKQKKKQEEMMAARKQNNKKR